MNGIRARLLAGVLAAGMLVSAAASANWAPGVYALAAKQLTTAVTGEAQTAITNLVGMSAATIEVAFAYGSGGTSCAVVVQTSADGGTTWRDVAYFAFTTASAVKYANLSGLTPKAITSYAALSTEGVQDGFLGDRMRAVITSVGTYATTTVTARISAR